AVAPFSLFPFDFTATTLLLSAASMFGRVSPNNKLPKESVIALALFVPIVIIVASSIIWSPQGSYSLSKALHFCTIATFLFCAPLLLNRIDLLTVISTIFFLSIVYSILYFFTQPDTIGTSIEINYLSSSRFIATGACIGFSLTIVGIIYGE